MDALPSTIKEADLSLPVLKRALSVAEYMTLLRSALLKRYDPRPIPKIDLKCITQFSDYLSHLAAPSVMPDETLLDTFLEWLLSKYSEDQRRYCEKVVSVIRILTNLFPPDILQRPLLTNRERQGHNRFAHLTPETQEILTNFLTDGRKTITDDDKVVATEQLLSQSVRRSTIGGILLLLKTIKKDDLVALSPTDIDAFIVTYAKQGKRDTAISLVADTRPLFRNLLARGKILSSPLPKKIQKSKKINGDFVPPEEMAKLQDISTVDMGNLWDIRDRLITFTLCYEFCLRVGEVARLDVRDVHVNSSLEITVRSEIQKGQDKPTVTLFGFYDESRELFQRYLKLRRQMDFDSEALLVSDTGNRLKEDGCRYAVQNQCEKLGIRTMEGQTANPHRFRHSFPTNNVSELGLRLDLTNLMRRLRHTDVALTYNTYIANNPLLNRAQHEAKMVEIKARNGQTSYPHAARSSVPMRPACADDTAMPESEALNLLRRLGIVRESLRRYCMAQGKCQMRDGEYFYSRGFVQDIGVNYFSKQEAMTVFGVKRSAFAYWMDSRAVVRLQIGKVTLISKENVLERCNQKN